MSETKKITSETSDKKSNNMNSKNSSTNKNSDRRNNNNNNNSDRNFNNYNKTAHTNFYHQQSGGDTTTTDDNYYYDRKYNRRGNNRRNQNQNNNLKIRDSSIYNEIEKLSKAEPEATMYMQFDYKTILDLVYDLPLNDHYEAILRWWGLFFDLEIVENIDFVVRKRYVLDF